MNNYSDLQDIDNYLICRLELVPVGTPEVSVVVGNNYAGGKIFQPTIIEINVELLKPFVVEIELKNKVYDHVKTSIKIKKLQIDGIDLVPKYDYLASYVNDHNNSSPTSELAFNGKWRLTFDRPFYQWLHQVIGQGWLIS